MIDNVSQDRVAVSKEQEQAVTELFGAKFLQLSKDEAACLSKVLFPDTHTEEITLLGVKRRLRPLSLKFSKRLFTALEPISASIQVNVQRPESVDMSSEIIDAMKVVVEILAEFYDWQDVKLALPEDELSLTELQALCTLQQKINGANDFLLGPLRVIVRTQQIQEVATVKFHTMFSSRVSPESGIAL